MENKNGLAKEKSLYLQQHAENPVDWRPWSSEVFEIAKRENKLVLISIGYSACHWCHVMEKESFEDEDIASIMNEWFVCVKVDREERPDIDQVYMDAVQMMSNQGGWPLNCFTLPNGKPIYGGTYFPKEQWVRILHELHRIFTQEREKMDEYGEKLTKGIQALNTGIDQEKEYSKQTIQSAMEQLKSSFDRAEGGENRAPKFPMPVNKHFLLNYLLVEPDQSIEKQLQLTLDKMALGGIYDQVGGGFARYSVDMLWKAPHFEKMLYDNGQLLSLYSQAYRYFKSPLYQDTITGIIDFLMRDFKGEHLFYAAMDADSEGEEGAFYTWTKEELESALEEDYRWVKEYYNVNDNGHFEKDKYILLRRDSDEAFCKRMNWSMETLKEAKSRVDKKLFEVREKREKPGIDKKHIVSWNSMAIKGLADAGVALQNKAYIKQAEEMATYINTALRVGNKLYHQENAGEKKIDGFLDDYAFFIEACISLYEATFKEMWMETAIALTDHVVQHFSDEQGLFFYYTADDGEQLIVRKKEFSDNVIPASNSVMANTLYHLGLFLGEGTYLIRTRKMLAASTDNFSRHPSFYAHWGNLMIREVYGVKQVVFTGEDYKEQYQNLLQEGVFSAIYAGAKNTSEFQVFKGRFQPDKSPVFVCREGVCHDPVYGVEEVVKAILS